MRLLADACISRSLVQALRDANHDVVYVHEGPPGVEDTVVLDIARSDGRILLTEDHDFGALAVRDNRASAGVVLIELHGLSSGAQNARVLATLATAADQLAGHFTVVEPSRVRSRPLDPS